MSAFETIITKGGKVAEKDLINSIELLMNRLLKLEGITADGDVKLQRKTQVLKNPDLLKANPYPLIIQN